ncbi:hypothetical protein ACLKA7_011032 [Drosophila subpalustris]
MKQSPIESATIVVAPHRGTSDIYRISSGLFDCAQTGNLTRDFMEQFFGEETQLGSLVGEKNWQMSDKELNQRLVQNFQRFFKHRDIKLHFLPGRHEDMQLNLINLPSMTGAVGGTSASVETYEPEAEGDSKQQGLGAAVHGGEGGGGGGVLNKRKKKQSYKTTMLQVAVPILVLPIVLLGSLLPFILPTLKMATILSLFMNNGAFMAAMLYAYASATASSAANQPQHINYGYSEGFH